MASGYMYCSFDADTLTDPLQSTGGHWPFSVHFSKMADQNLMANQIHTCIDMTKWPTNSDTSLP